MGAIELLALSDTIRERLSEIGFLDELLRASQALSF
jgi:hypothetical protein